MHKCLSFEAFVAYNGVTWRLQKNLFSYNSKLFQTSKDHEKMITFLKKKDYFFKKKWLLF